MARRGPGERVDGLRGVPDHADVVTLADPQVEQPLLHGVDVLVLVDHEVAVLAADGAGDVLALGEDADHHQQHVLEVDHAPLGLDLLVGLEQPRHGGGVQPGRVASGTAGGGGVGLGGQHADLGPLDLGGEVAHGRPVELEAQPRAGLGDDRGLVRQHLRRGTTDRLRPEVVQLAQRRGVEGAGLHPADRELAQAGAHLPRRPRGEGDREDPLRLVGTAVDAVRDAVGDRPGLAGARTGQDAHRARSARRRPGAARGRAQPGCRRTTVPSGSGWGARSSSRSSHPGRVVRPAPVRGRWTTGAREAIGPARRLSGVTVPTNRGVPA